MKRGALGTSYFDTSFDLASTAFEMLCIRTMKYSLVLALAASLGGQFPRFDVQSRLVSAPVTVTDKAGHPVDSLTASDFLVLDNGRPQKVISDTFATGVVRSH